MIMMNSSWYLKGNFCPRRYEFSAIDDFVIRTCVYIAIAIRRNRQPWGTSATKNSQWQACGNRSIFEAAAFERESKSSIYQLLTSFFYLTRSTWLHTVDGITICDCRYDFYTILYCLSCKISITPFILYTLFDGLRQLHHSNHLPSF